MLTGTTQTTCTDQNYRRTMTVDQKKKKFICNDTEENRRIRTNRTSITYREVRNDGCIGKRITQNYRGNQGIHSRDTRK